MRALVPLQTVRRQQQDLPRRQAERTAQNQVIQDLDIGPAYSAFRIQQLADTAHEGKEDAKADK